MDQHGGLYVVALSLPAPAGIRVGALGRIAFPPGVYLYIGSAARGLDSRLARHKALRGKKLRWHVDYLRRKARWEGAAVFPSGTGECLLATDVMGAVGGTVAYPRFGASDCRCSGHLIHTAISPASALARLRTMSAASPPPDGASDVDKMSPSSQGALAR